MAWLSLQVYGHMIKKKEGGPGMRVAMTTTDHAFCLLQQTGHVAWCREEALSSIVAVETVDLPVSQIDAEMEEEFGSTQGQGQSINLLLECNMYSSGSNRED